jgi:hypothetical protein
MTMQSARADLSASVCLNPNGSKSAQRAPLASTSTSRGGAPVPRKAASSSTRLTLHPKRTRTPSSKQSLKSECCSCASTDPARSEASQSHRYTEALSGALVPRRSGGGPYLGSHQESSGVIRSHQESPGGGPYLGSHQESSGVIRSHQESSGVIRSHQESSGGGPYLGSHQESSGVIRSHQESSGVIRRWAVPGKSSGVIRSHQESSGVIRSHQESSGVIRRERTCEVPQRRTSSEAKIEGSSSFTPSSAKSRSTHGHRWSTCSLVKRSRPSSTCVLTARVRGSSHAIRGSEAVRGSQRQDHRPLEATRGHHW